MRPSATASSTWRAQSPRRADSTPPPSQRQRSSVPGRESPNRSREGPDFVPHALGAASGRYLHLITPRTPDELARRVQRGALDLAPAEPALITDQELVHRRIAAALANHGVRRLRHFVSLDEFLASVGVEAPEIAIVCWERVGPEEAASLAQLHRACPETNVVIVAASFARSSLTAALESGLAAFVREAELDECLLLAVEAARRGQLLLPREFGKMATQPALSAREKQTLALVVMGLSNAEIARTLFVTESTVKSHLSSAFTRLGVRSRNQATALILDPERGFGTGILSISGDERRGPRPRSRQTEDTHPID